MLTEEQLKNLSKLAEKNQDVKFLLEFYQDCQKDGLKALRFALNKKLLDISSTVESVRESDNDDKTFERIDRIVTSLKKLPKEAGEHEEKENESFLDRAANKKRKDK
jgi:hypothetical protein